MGNFEQESHFVTLLLLSASAVAVFYFLTKKGKLSFSLAPVSQAQNQFSFILIPP